MMGFARSCWPFSLLLIREWSSTSVVARNRHTQEQPNLAGAVHHFLQVCNWPKHDPRPKLASIVDTRLTGQAVDVLPSQKAFAAKAVRVMDVFSKDFQRSPQISVTVGNCFGTEDYGTCLATPDTGADGCVMSLDLLGQMHIPVEQLAAPPETRILTANGSELKCVGTLQLGISYGDHSANIQALVCKNHSGFLLAWTVCRDLGIIPQDYPRPISVSTCSADRDMPGCGAISSVLGPLPDQPSSKQREDIRQRLVAEFSDVFAVDTELKCMSGPPMKIHIKPDAEPFAVHTARPIPYALRDAVHDQLRDMEAKGIITPIGDEPSQWCHPLVIVPKANGGVRICVDLTKLNKHVSRAHYPLKTPKDSVASVPASAQYFSTLDATTGYWQLPLAPECQELTTFITPWGRFRFLRSPMGLVSTGDEYCRRGDIALSGIENLEKVVDDMLAYDAGFPEHVARVWTVLSRCRAQGITLNPTKFRFAEDEVKFVGFIVSRQGTRADPRKIAAIQEFPAPTNVSELRSFLGLVNQLGEFTDGVAASAQPLRELLKGKSVFAWTPAQEDAFRQTKEALSSPPTLAHFDPSRPTMLQTDASRLKGLGFALLQKVGDSWRLVQCGSRFLSDTESRYAMIELELLAVVWATQKCRTYLLGLPSFTIVVDHQPLIPILNQYTLDMVENTRLQRLKAKLSMYVFTATWRKGKDHAIPDALSRAPVMDPSEEDIESAEDIQSMTSIASVIRIAEIDAQPRIQSDHLVDPLLESLRQAAKDDEGYQQLVCAVQQGFPKDQRDISSELRHFQPMQHDLTVDDGLVLLNARIVIPTSARRDTLSRLHAAHQGLVRTKRRARQAVYWPAMNADITSVIQRCAICQEMQASQASEPPLVEPSPARVFEDVSADLFSYAGNTYLVGVDRLSGWPSIHVWYRKDPSAADVIKVIRQNFTALGVPVRFRSDNGPQFKARAFQLFLEQWGVRHAPSTPYNPQSNGLAESAVKAMKRLVEKTTKNGCLDDDAFDRGLLEYRNTPRSGGLSPAQIVFGHPVRSVVPTHHLAFQDTWQQKLAQLDRDVTADALAKKTPKPARRLRQLGIGDEVFIQNPTTCCVHTCSRSTHRRSPEAVVQRQSREPVGQPVPVAAVAPAKVQTGLGYNTNPGIVEVYSSAND